MTTAQQVAARREAHAALGEYLAAWQNYINAWAEGSDTFAALKAAGPGASEAQVRAWLKTLPRVASAWTTAEAKHEALDYAWKRYQAITGDSAPPDISSFRGAIPPPYPLPFPRIRWQLASRPKRARSPGCVGPAKPLLNRP